jgi:sulfite exporter TauE/SafE
MLVRLNGGRIALYALAGGIFAGTAGLTIGPNATAATYKLLQWASAAVLMWAGLALAGVVPRLALPERIGAVSAATGRFVAPAGLPRGLTPVAMGVAWGLTPCPMAYAALFSAMMTGSALGGIAWMTGFGLGTLPGVLGASLGIAWIAQLKASRHAEVVAGVAVAAFGLFTVLVPWAQVAAFCFPS